ISCQFVVFFFSSRRRHTRCYRDWSSDVCSSDLVLEAAYQGSGSNMYAKKDVQGGRGFGLFLTARLDYVEKLQNYDWVVCDLNIRSEERRVGKECRYRRSSVH